jgi:hypothetical protein
MAHMRQSREKPRTERAIVIWRYGVQCCLNVGKTIASVLAYLPLTLFNNKVRVFIVSALMLFTLALTYPILLVRSFNLEDAWIYFKHNPNFSVFALAIMPLAVGLFLGVMRAFRHHKMPRFWKIWIFLGGIIIVPIMVTKDALYKGPPIQPTHIGMTSSQKLSVLGLEKNLRKRYWREKQPDPKELQRLYVTGVAKILNLPEKKVLRFDDLKDFLQRASVIAFYDLLVSFIGSAFVVLMYGFFGFLQLKKIDVDDKHSDALTLVYILFILWIPCRLYSLWYQNFYTLTNSGQLVIFVVFVGCAGLFYVGALYAKGALVRLVAIIQAAIVAVIAIIGFVKPDLLFKFLGEVSGEISFELLISCEIVLFTLLLTAIWPYLEEDDEKNKNSESK